MARFTLNGENISAPVDPETPLLWVLRDTLDKTGTKYGCGIGVCGACTVHLNGEAIRSCQMPVGLIDDQQITTIEGLSEDRSHPVQQAWIEEQVPQCGYCQSGMIMAVAALLEASPEPTDEEISATITNICRCGTYVRIRPAIRRAVELSKSAG